MKNENMTVTSSDLKIIREALETLHADKLIESKKATSLKSAIVESAMPQGLLPEGLDEKIQRSIKEESRKRIEQLRADMDDITLLQAKLIEYERRGYLNLANDILNNDGKEESDSQ